MLSILVAKAENTKNYYSDNSHACCFWIKILTGSQWGFLTHVFSMPKLKDKFTLSKSSQIISLRFKKNKLWVNLSNLMSHQVSHDYSADKSLTDYKFCDIFSSREAIHKRYNENHICIFQYSSNHIKNKRKLVIVI